MVDSLPVDQDRLLSATGADHDQTAVIPIALWSTRIFGTLLMFGAPWLSAKRNRQRDTILFSTTLAVFYVLFDLASMGFANFFTICVALTMSLKLVAALAGGLIAFRLRPVVSAEPSPKANSVDVFQSVWYRLVLLLCVVTAAASWFVEDVEESRECAREG